MAKINDYLWHLPHESQADDPPDVALLQQAFNMPIVEVLQQPLAEMGYELKSSDVMVRLDERMDNTADTYYANVRFIHYMAVDVITRVHFEHLEWAHILSTSEAHRYVINLDRFKLSDPERQIVAPQWEGRLHTRMSNRPHRILEHSGPDQVWEFRTLPELDQQLTLFLDKFREMGQRWLENENTMSG